MTSHAIKPSKTYDECENCIDAIVNNALIWGFVYSIGTALAAIMLATFVTGITVVLADVYTVSLVIFTMGGALRGLIMWYVQHNEEAQVSIMIPFLTFRFAKYQPPADSEAEQRLTVGATRVQKPDADNSIDFTA